MSLLMRTIVNKIGHGKLTARQVAQKELEMLRTLEFRVGAPTLLEFLERYLQDLQGNLISQISPDELTPRVLHLAKLACCSYDLMQVPFSVLAAGILTLGVKLAVTA